MPFCPACRSEFRPGFVRCEECDADLVATRPSEPLKPTFIPRVPVFQSQDYSDAVVVTAVLNENGIPAVIDNENSVLWLMGMPTPAIPLLVQVPREAAQAAGELLRDRVVDPVDALKTPRHRRRWLLALALFVPALAGGGGLYLGDGDPLAAAGAWAALALGLILDLRGRAAAPGLSEPKIGFFFLLGCLAAGSMFFFPSQIAAVEPHWAGVFEEPMKLLPVMAALTLADRRNRFAWVLAAAASGAGFGMVENLLKFRLYPTFEDGFDTAVTGLMHPALTGIVGFMIAMHGWKGGVGGLLIAVVLHGIWNALAVNDLFLLCLLFMVGAAWIYFKTADGLIAMIPGGSQPVAPPSSPSAPAT